MQKDFHYFVVYYLSLCAGIEPDTAYKIAYSSQYVDDSTESRKMSLFNKKGDKIGYVDPVRTAHNGLESFWEDVWQKIYYPFHFVPGNEGEDLEEKYITRGGDENKVAREYLDRAIKTDNPYRIGIALHAYADTFSHKNFSGRWSEVNNVKNMNVYYSNLRRKKLKNNILLWFYTRFLRKPIPAIGHSEALKVPDKPFYFYEYFNHKNKKVPIANEERYLGFAESVYEDFLSRVPSGDHSTEQEQFENIKNKILFGIYKEGSLRKRSKHWKKLIKEKLNNKKIPKYNKYIWRKEAFGRKVRWDKRKRSDEREISMIPKSKLLKSNWMNFHKAALEHRIEALRILNKAKLVPKKTLDQVEQKLIADIGGEKIKPVLN
jgi:hypothetical protein